MDNRAESRQMIKEQLNRASGIPDRDKKALRFRFGFATGHTHTLAATGKKFGISRERVRQIERRALCNLPPSVSKAVLQPVLVERKISPATKMKQAYWEEQARIGLKKGWLLIERGHYWTTDLGCFVAGGWLRLALQSTYNHGWVSPEVAVTKARAILGLRNVSIISEADAGPTGPGNYLSLLPKAYASMTTEEREDLGLPTGLPDKTPEIAVLCGMSLQPGAKSQALRLRQSLSGQLRYQDNKKRGATKRAKYH